MDLPEAVSRGLGAHVEAHRARLAAGAERLGWKVAFNARPIQERLGIPASLVAGLTRATLRAPGSAYALGGSGRTALEAEVAVWLGADVHAQSTLEDAARAVDAWAPAVEVVELDRPFDQLEQILAEGVFHRAVVPGGPVPAPPGADLGGRTVRVVHGGGVVCEVDSRAATGHAPEVLLHLARLLGPHDERLRRGDLVILGAMNPLTLARPGEPFGLELGELGSVHVDVTD